MQENKSQKLKTVYTIVERDNRSYWVKIGIGFVNRDGSLKLRLDAAPTNGELHVRDYESPEEREHRFERSNQQPRATPEALS